MTKSAEHNPSVPQTLSVKEKELTDQLLPNLKLLRERHDILTCTSCYIPTLVWRKEFQLAFRMNNVVVSKISLILCTSHAYLRKNSINGKGSNNFKS